MVARLCAVFCLLLFVSLSFAETEELPELQAETMQDSWLEQFYRELAAGKYKLSANSRFRFAEDENTGLLGLQLKQSNLDINTNLYLREEENTKWNASIAYGSNKTAVRKLQLGSMRCGWGMGTILKNPAGREVVYSIGKAPHPHYTSLQGVAGVLGHGKLSLFFMGSENTRPARITDERISYLYSSQRDGLNHVAEQVLATGVVYQPKYLAAGILGYWQKYDRAFADPEYQQQLRAISLFTKLATPKLDWSFEGAVMGSKPAGKTELSISLPSFSHRLGASYLAGKQLPAYAARPSLLSGYGERHELYWDISIPFTRTIDVSLRHAVSRQNSSIKSSAWQSRSIFALGYHPKDTKVSVQFTRLDKEVLVQSDSSYAATLPQHYRLLLSIGQQLPNNLNFAMQFRYHHEDKLKQQNNSFYLQNSLQYSRKAWQLEGGIRTWQSLYTIMLPDTGTDNPEGYSTSSNEDFRCFTRCSIRYTRLRISAELQQSFQKHLQTVYLGVAF